MTTKQQENVNKILSWSKINSKPVLLYVEEYDETLVAWQGILLNKVIALNLVLESFGKYPTPMMKQKMIERYKQLYITGFFGDQKWDSFFNKRPGDFFSYLRRITKNFIPQVTRKKDITEILSWFKE